MSVFYKSKILSQPTETMAYGGEVKPPKMLEGGNINFNLSVTGSKNVRETQIGKFVNNLGEMAKDYPELQTALQEYFAENVVDLF